MLPTIKFRGFLYSPFDLFKSLTLKKYQVSNFYILCALCCCLNRYRLLFSKFRLLSKNSYVPVVIYMPISYFSEIVVVCYSFVFNLKPFIQNGNNKRF